MDTDKLYDSTCAHRYPDHTGPADPVICSISRSQPVVVQPSHGSTMQKRFPRDTSPNQALAEPSGYFQASAVPSSDQNVLSTNSQQAHKPRLVFRASNLAPISAPIPYSQQAISKRKEIITTIWPSTTSAARLQFPEFCRVYDQVKSFNLPNFLGARLSLNSGLHVDVWRSKLAQYHDNEICTFLEYGWPVGYHSTTPLVSAESNHPSANHHSSHIQKFINTELSWRHGWPLPISTFRSMDTLLSLNDSA